MSLTRSIEANRFVPFINERDGLGKLIGSVPSNLDNLMVPSTQRSKVSKRLNQNHTTENSSRLERSHPTRVLKNVWQSYEITQPEEAQRNESHMMSVIESSVMKCGSQLPSTETSLIDNGACRSERAAISHATSLIPKLPKEFKWNNWVKKGLEASLERKKSSNSKELMYLPILKNSNRFAQSDNRRAIIIKQTHRERTEPSKSQA